jgi:hypothetical protein
MTAIKALILATTATAVFAGPASAATTRVSDGTSNTLQVAEMAPRPPQGIIAVLIGL